MYAAHRLLIGRSDGHARISIFRLNGHRIDAKSHAQRTSIGDSASIRVMCVGVASVVGTGVMLVKILLRISVSGKFGDKIG